MISKRALGFHTHPFHLLIKHLPHASRGALSPAWGCSGSRRHLCAFTTFLGPAAVERRGREAGPKPPESGGFGPASLRGGVGRDALPSPARVVVVWVEAAFQ